MGASAVPTINADMTNARPTALFLQSALGISGNPYEYILGKLRDPEAGNVGADLNRALAESGCHFMDAPLSSAAGKEYTPAAYYVNYTLEKNRQTLMNTIFFKTDMSKRNTAEVVRSLTHDAAGHVLELNAAVGRATPFRRGNNHIPDAEGWVARIVAGEINACVKQAWLSSLAVKNFPELRELSKYDAISIGEWEQIRAQAPDLETAMQEAAKIAMSKHWGTGDDGTPYTFLDYNIDYAIGLYELNPRIIAGEKFKTFQLHEQDIIDLGKGVGPNPFGQESLARILQAVRSSRPEFRERIAGLDAKIGTSNGRTLQQNLAAEGVGAKYFMSEGYVAPEEVAVGRYSALAVAAA